MIATVITTVKTPGREACRVVDDGEKDGSNDGDNNSGGGDATDEYKDDDGIYIVCMYPPDRVEREVVQLITHVETDL
jgi:hypothetical protein